MQFVRTKHPPSTATPHIQVWVYTNGDEVELLLNGASLGTSAVTQWDKVVVAFYYSGTSAFVFSFFLCV